MSQQIIQKSEYKSSLMISSASSQRNQQQTEKLIQNIYVSKAIFCQLCKRQLISMPYIYAQYSSFCVGCFSSVIFLVNRYSVVDLSKTAEKHSPLALEDEMITLQGLERWGIDSLELIGQHMKKRLDQSQIKSHINYIIERDTKMAQRVQLYDKTKSTLSSQDTIISELQSKSKNHKDKHKIYQAPKTLKQKNYKMLFDKQYQLSDYLLASLHPDSNPAILNYLSNHKLEEGRIQQQIEQNLKRIMLETPYTKYQKISYFWRNNNILQNQYSYKHLQVQQSIQFKTDYQKQIEKQLKSLKKQSMAEIAKKVDKMESSRMHRLIKVKIKCAKEQQISSIMLKTTKRHQNQIKNQLEEDKKLKKSILLAKQNKGKFKSKGIKKWKVERQLLRLQ